MCRFVLYLGPSIPLGTLITEPAHSLIRQSLQSRHHVQPVNGDGFGVAWYVPEIGPEATLFRSVFPAWNNQNLIQLARVTGSSCILAHVRAATPGFPVTETNCHPFTSGPYAFMHNGDVGGFQQVRRALLSSLSDESFAAIKGSTDSEHLFAVFLDCLGELRTLNSGKALAEALRQTIKRATSLVREHQITEHSYLNLAVSDGRRATVARFTTDREEQALSLFLHTGKRYVCENGVCRMVDPESGREAVIVSSEPLSRDPGWTTVPHNHLVIVEEDRSVTVEPI